MISCIKVRSGTTGLVAVLGFGVVKATAHTKLCNVASNLAGLATFALGGHVIWMLGLAMGLASFVGAQIGARLAMRLGARLVKPLIVTISLVLAAKLALTLLTFGFKNGPPRDADLVLDVRFLPNPHYREDLRPLTGRDPAVVEHIEAGELARIRDLVAADASAGAGLLLAGHRPNATATTWLAAARADGAADAPASRQALGEAERAAEAVARAVRDRDRMRELEQEAAAAAERRAEIDRDRAALVESLLAVLAAQLAERAVRDAGHGGQHDG